MIHHRVTVFSRTTASEDEGEVEDLKRTENRDDRTKEDGRRQHGQRDVPEELKLVRAIHACRLGIRDRNPLKARQ